MKQMFYLLLLISSLAAKAQLPRDDSHRLYLISVTTQLPFRAIEKELIARGAVDLNRRTPGSHLSFSIHKNTLAQLLTQWREQGQWTIEKSKTNVKNREGWVRVSFWYKKKRPESGVRSENLELVQTVRGLPKPQRKKVQISKERFSETLIELVDAGPLQIRPSALFEEITNNYNLDVYQISDQRETPPLKSFQHIFIDLLPQQNLNEKFIRALESLLKANMDQVVQSENEEEWLMRGRASNKIFLPLMELVGSRCAVILTKQKEITGEELLIGLRYRKPDVVQRAVYDTDQVETIVEVVKNENKSYDHSTAIPDLLPQRAKWNSNFYLGGSQITARTGEQVRILSTGGNIEANQYSFYFRHLENQNAPSDMQIKTQSFSMGYRYDFNSEKDGPSLAAYLDYQITEPHQGVAQFMGGSLLYRDRLWRWANSVLDVVPFLRYPKYIEIGAQGLPLSTDNKIKSISAYTGYLRGKIRFTDYFEVYSSIYGHQINYKKENELAVNNQFSFADLGLGFVF